jgi:hypothetical protein
MDEDSRITIEYLRGLPPGARVRWSTHHLSPERPWTSRWVDVRIEDEGAPPFGWAWTIIGEDDREGSLPGQLWQFVWPYGLDVHEVWDPVEPPLVIGRLVGSWAVPRGAPEPPEVTVCLQQAPEGVDRGHVVFGGWSAQAVGEALTHWAATHAGRPDLRFDWDPSADLPPAVAQAADRARAVADGGATWDLGDGLVVADGVMDDLLAMDPDERDEVMEAFREVDRYLRPGTDPRT